MARGEHLHHHVNQQRAELSQTMTKNPSQPSRIQTIFTEHSWALDDQRSESLRTPDPLQNVIISASLSTPPVNASLSYFVPNLLKYLHLTGNPVNKCHKCVALGSTQACRGQRLVQVATSVWTDFKGSSDAGFWGLNLIYRHISGVLNTLPPV